VKPRDSSSSNSGIQYTPVDSIATVSTRQTLSQYLGIEVDDALEISEQTEI